jgi:hypothetical protein
VFTPILRNSFSWRKPHSEDEFKNCTKSSKYVWVLSARHSYDKKLVTGSAQNAYAYDENDGYDRMNLGIEVARNVAALKLGKKASELTNDEIRQDGPTILYNGEEESNASLQIVLDTGGIQNYPKDKFLIFSLPSGQVHTGGQFQSLYSQNAAGEVDLVNSTLAIVTHAYHWPRAARYFWNNLDFTVVAYLVDRNFESPGTSIELQNEILKFPRYIAEKYITESIDVRVSY